MATLTFDPDGDDLEIWAASTIRTTAFSSPAPPLETVTAGSIDTEGDRVVARRHQNRQVNLTVEVTASTAALTRAALETLEAKVAKLAADGGELKWINDDSEPFTFDIDAADNYDFSFDHTYLYSKLAVATISLVAKPYLRGDEVTLSSVSETTLPALVFTKAGIQGDVPALGRLVVTEGSATVQGVLVWGVQSRYYDSDADAALFMQGEAIQYTGTSASVGASGANTAYQGTIGTTWAPVTVHNGRHIGGFRVLARFKVPATNTGTVQARLAWRSGDRPYVYNAPVTLETEGIWLIKDLGEMLAQEQRYGDPASATQIEVKGTVGTDDVYIDWMMLVPTTEGSGEATSSSSLFNAPLYPSGEFHLLHDGVATYAAAPGWGEPYSYEGDHLTIPVGHTTVQFIVKAFYDWTEDATIDDISAQLHYVPRWLHYR